MTPMESWALIALVVSLVAATTFQGGRIMDWMLDRVFSDLRPESGSVTPRHGDCPCAVDRQHHARTARHLASEKHSTRSTS